MLPEALRRAVFWTSDAVWGPWTMALLLGTALFLTIRFRFIQITRFGEGLRTLVPEQESAAKGPLTPFQAFMTALAATIGTGNIAGVATAIVTGGPGAIFWIWVYGFFATTIKFSEAVLGIRFRLVENGRVSAGPMHYLRNGLGLARLGWLYALIAGVAALTTTPFTQPNSVAEVFWSQLGVPTWASGVGLAVLTWLVVIGGITAIGRTMEKLSPLKVGLYLVGGLVVILTHIERLPEVMVLIVREAFSIGAVTGGTAGTGVMVALRYGLARGIYANEAGYGTAAVAYGTARSDRPAQQGLNAVMEVFIVSMVTSTISALTILLSGAWSSPAVKAGQIKGSAVVAAGFDTAMPGFGGVIVALCAFLFGYTTLIGWSYYGEQFLEHIFGRRIVMPYRWIYCLLIPLGAVSKVDVVWAWGDLMNGLQIFPNLVGLIGLSGVVAAIARRRGDAPAPRR
jgi:AGCS family alanine or glycine:cation symporter